jgi:hypothetical protein
VDIGLVMESEWAQGFVHLKYDFEKLLVARSSHRLFIYQGPQYQESVEIIADRLIEGINRFPFSQPGDRYLFAAYDTNEGVFRFMPFVVP